MRMYFGLGVLLAVLLGGLTAQTQQVDGLFYPPLLWRDEGTDQGRSARAVNCVGSGISCSFAAGVVTITASSGAVSISTVVLSAPGNGLSRYTITDAAVTASSKIVGTVRRPDVEDVDDHGWIFVPNIVKIGSGSFDLIIQVLTFGDGGDDPLIADPPTGTIEFQYVVG
jgi:hypothetical protein